MQNIFQTVSQDLLQANQIGAEEIAQSLAIIGTHHVDYADIYCQRTAYESWHLDEGIVKSGSFQIDQGVGVRAVSGEKTAFAYADSLTTDAIQRAAETVKVIGASGNTVPIRVPTPVFGKAIHGALIPLLVWIRQPKLLYYKKLNN